MFETVWVAPDETAAPVDDLGRIERFLLNSGLTAPSLDALRDDFPRWLKRLGGVHIPLAPWLAGPGDAKTVNLLSLWTLQASPRKDNIAKRLRHDLRTITGTRPYKP